jgi:hypothetical protein
MQTGPHQSVTPIHASSVPPVTVVETTARKYLPGTVPAWVYTVLAALTDRGDFVQRSLDLHGTRRHAGSGRDDQNRIRAQHAPSDTVEVAVVALAAESECTGGKPWVTASIVLPEPA